MKNNQKESSTPEKYRGNCSHIVDIHPETTQISVYNDDDGCAGYTQMFDSREEIMSFIKELQEATDKIFPESQS